MGTEKKKLAQVEAETQDEIQQIMSDIEGLQADLADSQKPGAKVPPTKLKAVQNEPVVEAADGGEAYEDGVAPEQEIDMSDFRGSGDEPSMEETLAGMKEEETSGNSLLDDPTPEAQPEAIEDKEAVGVEAADVGSRYSYEETVMKKMDGAPEGTLTMTLTGNMSLRLNYECDGQAVMVGFENGSLKVELADGTEFKIPVSRTRKMRVA